jgi:tetratricopeptide (TPR) repeat protein
LEIGIWDLEFSRVIDMLARVKRSVLIGVLPVAAGVIVGGLASTNKILSRKSLPVPAISPETSTPKAIPHSITHYLLTSQSLFSKAIELSRKDADNTDKETRMNTDTNKRIVQLVNEAISQATQAIVHYPSDPRGWAQRAKIYQSVEKYLENASDLAISDYKMALQLDRQNTEYPKKLSQLYQEKEDFSSAIAYLKIAAEAAPTDAQTWFDLAQLQAKAGRIEQAYKSYQRILPLLANQEQKQVVKKEIGALEALLAKAGKDNQNLLALPSPNPDQKPNKSIQLIEDAPLLEADNLAQKLIIAGPAEEKGKKSGQVSATNALSGNAIIPAGQTEVKIESRQLTDDTQVYVTPIGDDQNQVLRVKSKMAAKPSGYFIVAISKPLDHDLEFKWWIIRN